MRERRRTGVLKWALRFYMYVDNELEVIFNEDSFCNGLRKRRGKRRADRHLNRSIDA